MIFSPAPSRGIQIPALWSQTRASYGNISIIRSGGDPLCAQICADTEPSLNQPGCFCLASLVQIWILLPAYLTLAEY